MIQHISIRNFAIIAQAEADFTSGLNIITGETGSGKSIVIEAISLALGSRADSAYVRHGADKAVIQLAGTLDGEEVVITREISATGKNLCRLNGDLVTLTQLQETCRRLADIHGQYDNQSLLHPEQHIRLVDSFRQDTIAPVRRRFDEAYQTYRDLRRQLDALRAAEADDLRKQDFYRFAVSEIDRADLHPGEDTELADRVLLLQNSEKIYDGIETAYGLLRERDNAALDALSQGLSALEAVSGYGKDIAAVHEAFADAYYRLEDVSDSLRSLREQVTFTPEELDAAITRLDQIDRLKKKYGATVEEILTYRDSLSESLSLIENSDARKAALEQETAAALDTLRACADALTKVRQESAAQLQEAIEAELRDLNFGEAHLAVDFRTPEAITPEGNDIVEFLISTNRGEPLKPLAKIASGGEISRIMLAIRHITGAYDRIPTMIFDEIDAGISGVTASVVGRKLRGIARDHQILCITHLPQIAVQGDAHFRIQKDTDNTSTFTSIQRLSEPAVIDEIARLLGGDNITDTTRKSAEELRRAARA